MNVIRTKSPWDVVKRAVRARYWRWRAAQAETDAEYASDNAALAEVQAEACSIAARQWRDRAWRIERGVE